MVGCPDYINSVLGSFVPGHMSQLTGCLCRIPLNCLFSHISFLLYSG